VVEAVSTARIYGYQKALFDFDSKHISRPGNKLAGDYLYETYKSFGYEPEYQWFDHRNALGGRTANVLAMLPGTMNPELVYVVSSHYDSVAGGPGADDDSSGTAALLEAARVLKEHPMPATIVFASFTGEEAGLLGSREYVRRAVEGKTRIVGALNNDMIGWANDQRLDNTIRYSNPGIRDVQHGAAMLFTKLITYDSLYFKSTDAAAYYDAYGDIVGGIGSHPVLSNPHYHQSHDFLEFINHQLVAETSKTTVATLMLLASSPSRLTDLQIRRRTTSATTVSWAPSPEKGVTGYVVTFGTSRITSQVPEVSLPPLPSGTVVAVKAVNDRGLEGWDWARVTVP
jgi:Zn-dependent M28 family amino/carboxypeptidase